MDPSESQSDTAANPYELLRRLEDRLDQASRNAERLIAEAAAEAAGQRTAGHGAAGRRGNPAGERSSGSRRGGSAGRGGGGSAGRERSGSTGRGGSPGGGGSSGGGGGESTGGGGPSGGGEGGDGIETPAAGWQMAEEAEPRHRGLIGGDLGVLLELIQGVRDLIPPELQRQLMEAVRELLMALRALIDWYLERLERRRAESFEVQDIPIL